MDAGFWERDFEKRSFEKWVRESYNSGIQYLVKFWVEQIEQKRKVPWLYPFLGLMRSLLLGEKSLLRCGSGWINYSILTDGTIVPCPIMSGIKDFYLDHISNTHPLKLRKVLVSKPCTECEILNECGGRCLYANLTKRWNNETYNLVCDTVKNIVFSLKRELPRVRQLIAQGKIKLEDFNFTKHNCCEIIP